jgi:Zn-finger nucleic acid-binding protein
MDCPVCPNTKLVMTERQAVEIDYCPSCRGVWLDRGELDKIIEKSAVSAPIHQAEVKPSPSQQWDQKQGAYPYKKKKREGFLSELFDFD